MPNRMLRDWTKSDLINNISCEAERFFVRLIMKVDDYGCYYADSRLLKADLFPLKLDKIREADIPRWMDECQKAGLIVLYESSGKRFLQISDFRQRKRIMHRQFPPPTDVGHMTVIRPHEEEDEVEEEENTGPLAKSNLFRKPNIPTKQQVLEAIVSCGGTKEMAKSFYEKHESTGWYLNGSPIVSYKSLASRFVTNWKSNEKDKPKTDENFNPHGHLKKLNDGI